MKYTYTGKDNVVSDALKEKIEKKLSKIEKFLPHSDDIQVFVNFKTYKLENIVEVTIPIGKRTLRAEVRNDDMYSAIDQIEDILDKQVKKYKSKLKDKSRREPSYKEELMKAFADSQVDEESDEGEFPIGKVKKLELKPMDLEEAIMEMELLSHTFFVYKEAKSDAINVVYKRKDGKYGVIETE